MKNWVVLMRVQKMKWRICSVTMRSLGELLRELHSTTSNRANLVTWNSHRKESSPTPSVIASEHDGLTVAERRQRQALEYREEDGFAATDVIQQRIADVPIPK